jgi:hypothetical protein
MTSSGLKMDRVQQALEIVLQHVMMPKLQCEFVGWRSQYLLDEMKQQGVEMMFNVLSKSSQKQQKESNQEKATISSEEKLRKCAEETFQKFCTYHQLPEESRQWHKMVMGDFHVEELVASLIPAEVIILFILLILILFIYFFTVLFALFGTVMLIPRIFPDYVENIQTISNCRSTQ